METNTTTTNCPECGKEINVKDILHHPAIQQYIEDQVKAKLQYERGKLYAEKKEFAEEVERKAGILMSAESKIGKIMDGLTDLHFKERREMEKAWKEKEEKLESLFSEL